MPETTKEQEKDMKDRVKEISKFLDKNTEDLVLHPEVVAAIEDAIDNLQRRSTLIGF